MPRARFVSRLRRTSVSLAEPAESRSEELVRGLLRRYRRVPDFAELRRNGMVIGQRVSAESGVHLDPGFPWLIEIGDDVTFSIDVMVLAHDASTVIPLGSSRVARVQIGSRVFLGARSIVLPGRTIGDDCIIGAGSIVTVDVPSGTIVAGNPAKRVGATAEYVARHRERADAGPHWSPLEGTLSGGISPKQRVDMRDALAGRPGYVGDYVPGLGPPVR